MDWKELLGRRRKAAAGILAGVLAAVGLWGAFLLRFEFALPPPSMRMLLTALPLAVALKLAVFRLFALPQVGWRHPGLEDFGRIAAGHLAASSALALSLPVALGPAFPRSIVFLDFLLCLFLDGGFRAAVRLGLESRPPQGGRRTLIYGAGSAGLALLRELRAQAEGGWRVVGFLDDDPGKRGMRIHGLRVLGGRSDPLAELIRRHRVEEILIAMPRAGGAAVSEILEQSRAAGAVALRVPPLAELIANRVLSAQLREVRIEDLLEREPVHLDPERIRAHLEGRVVLVTGAGGSIGGELCRQIVRHAPEALIGFDHAEGALYEIEQELAALAPGVKFCAEVGSVQSRSRLQEVFERHRPAIVYHAAAYKHVPMMEAHLFEAVRNNVFGTRHLVRAAVAWGARDFVLISSDKAVRPASVMGATKRLAELVALAEARRAPKLPGAATKVTAVRFGNVLGSSGSVIPLFQRQIARGGPVTVTHPEMRRFFMTIPEAAQLVLEAGAMGDGGEIFVLEMGEPVRILDLARKMILLSGLRPEVDIPIVFSGARPGEKLFEELSAYEENTVATPHEGIRVLAGPPPDPSALAAGLERLREAVRARDLGETILELKELVPEYSPSQALLRSAWEARGARAALAARARSVVA